MSQKPVSYKDSPFFPLEAWHNDNQTQGFAYYTYGEGGTINMFTYVNENKVYQTTDEGNTWQDITPNEKWRIIVTIQKVVSRKGMKSYE